MIVSRAFAIMMLSVGTASCADPIESLCRTDVRERLINPDSAEFNDFSTVSYDDKISEMVEAGLNAPPAVPPGSRAAYRSELQRRARRMSMAWTRLEMSFHRYAITARGRSGRDVAATLDCAAARDICRCGSPLADRELYRS